MHNVIAQNEMVEYFRDWRSDLIPGPDKLRLLCLRPILGQIIDYSWMLFSVMNTSLLAEINTSNTA